MVMMLKEAESVRWRTARYCTVCNANLSDFRPKCTRNHFVPDLGVRKSVCFNPESEGEDASVRMEIALTAAFLAARIRRIAAADPVDA
jgi:hypothetical protein